MVWHWLGLACAVCVHVCAGGGMGSYYVWPGRVRVSRVDACPDLYELEAITKQELWGAVLEFATVRAGRWAKRVGRPRGPASTASTATAATAAATTTGEPAGLQAAAANVRARVCV